MSDDITIGIAGGTDSTSPRYRGADRGCLCAGG